VSIKAIGNVISIRAPRERSDPRVRATPPASPNFNPRSPRESDTSDAGCLRAVQNFNPRSPRESDAPGPRRRAGASYFNPRSPRESDSLAKKGLAHQGFQGILVRISVLEAFRKAILGARNPKSRTALEVRIPWENHVRLGFAPSDPVRIIPLSMQRVLLNKTAAFIEASKPVKPYCWFLLPLLFSHLANLVEPLYIGYMRKQHRIVN